MRRRARGDKLDEVEVDRPLLFEDELVVVVDEALATWRRGIWPHDRLRWDKGDLQISKA